MPSSSLRSQPISVPFADPWTELTQPDCRSPVSVAAPQDHQAASSRIEREVRRAEKRLALGREIEQILKDGGQFPPLHVTSSQCGPAAATWRVDFLPPRSPSIGHALSTGRRVVSLIPVESLPDRQPLGCSKRSV